MASRNCEASVYTTLTPLGENPRSRLDQLNVEDKGSSGTLRAPKVDSNDDRVGAAVRELLRVKRNLGN